jgi:CRISPR type III-B/RAMP module RAMP protein Cmr6
MNGGGPRPPRPPLPGADRRRPEPPRGGGHREARRPAGTARAGFVAGLPASSSWPPIEFASAAVEIVNGQAKLRAALHPTPAIPDFLHRSPNVGLLWHRYLPAHDLKAVKDRESAASPAGVALAEIWDAGSQTVNRTSELSTLAKGWAGFGCLNWFQRVAAGAQTALAPLLGELGSRRRREIESGGASRVFGARALRRIAVGLGLPAGFENSGVALERTYGFPILPGSSLKGLLSHFLAEEAPEPDELARSGWTRDVEELRQLVCGRTGTEGSEGAICFFDAWPLPAGEPWFEPDLVNPHHSKHAAGDPQHPVADDREDPVPSFFLGLRQGVRFEVALGLTASGAAGLAPAEQGKVLDLARRLLLLALRRWGIGARTGAGYGLFKEEEAPP